MKEPRRVSQRGLIREMSVAELTDYLTEHAPAIEQDRETEEERANFFYAKRMYKEELGHDFKVIYQ